MSPGVMVFAFERKDFPKLGSAFISATIPSGLMGFDLSCSMDCTRLYGSLNFEGSARIVASRSLSSWLKLMASAATF